MNKNKCSIKSCTNNILCKNVCNKHYQRLKKYGDPFKCKLNRGEGKLFTERFWSRVKISKSPTDCWIWTGYLNPRSGYGQLTYKNKCALAHRLAWFFLNGKWPNQDLLHSCNTPACVNIKHLREGDQAENNRDRNKSNRQAKGSLIHTTKLDEEKVKEIRQLLATGKTVTDIAKIYDVYPTTIFAIKKRINWKYVE